MGVGQFLRLGSAEIGLARAARGEVPKQSCGARGARCMYQIPGAARAGFTAMELMMVVALIAIVLAIALPVSRGLSLSNRRSQCAFNERTLGQALLAFRNDYRAFPRDHWETAGIGGFAASSVNIRGFARLTTGLYSLYSLTAYTASDRVVDGTTFSAASAAGGSSATFTDGSALVSGSGTTWTTAGVVPGDQIMLDSVGVWYAIDSVVDDQHLRLTTAVQSGHGGSGDATFRKMSLLNQQAWFAGGSFLHRLLYLHCPNNPVAEVPAVINVPLLGATLTAAGYNNYDLYYRRDWFHNPPYDARYYDSDTLNDPDARGIRDRRNLVESPYPPADTLITFCPYHRNSDDFRVGHPAGYPGDKRDEDMVLFADGAVLWLPSYPWDAITFNPATASPGQLNPAEWFSQRRAEAGE